LHFNQRVISLNVIALKLSAKFTTTNALTNTQQR
jgi:hypothetical protein